MRYIPHPYQETAERFIDANPFSLLAMEMGLGKTVVTATALERWLRTFESIKPLIVAPKYVAINTWPDEFQKWDHLQHLRVAQLACARSTRIETLRYADADVWVINRDNFRWLAAGYAAAHKPWPFDTVIIDESTAFKDHGTDRWKAATWARKFCSRVVMLTGTPITNSHMDLWGQIRILDQGQRLFKTVTDFRNYACVPAPSGFGWKLRDESMKRWIEERVSDIVLPMRAEDWLDMPELHVVDVPVALPPKARKAYDQMRKESQALGVAVGAEAQVLGKLAQIANGAMYDEDRNVIEIHDAKINALGEILEATGEPTIVCYYFKHDLARLQKRFPQGVEASAPGAIKRWNEGRIPILWLHSAANSEGLNLQAGGRHMVWFSLTYSLQNYLQTIARLHRQGQRNRVICHRLMADVPADRRYDEILHAKDGDLRSLVANLLAMPV